MPSIEVAEYVSGSENLNSHHRFFRAGSRIVAAMLVSAGIGAGSGSIASATKAPRAVTAPPQTPPNLIPGSNHRERTRDRSYTFANYAEAASVGPTLRDDASVEVDCVATDQQGNKWYHISRPIKGYGGYWDETTNFDNGYNGGTVVEIPTVDHNVPACPEPYEPVTPVVTSPTPTTTTTVPATTTTTTTIPRPTTTTTTTPSTYTEVAGSVAHTFTDPYLDANVVEDINSISDYQAVQITCAVQGWRSPQDGNDWWYKIASSPWNNQYYVSADAFYNELPVPPRGTTLIGTPFVDPHVPVC